MAAKQTASINASDYELSRVQNFLMKAINELPTSYPILNGQFVQTTVGTSDTLINHTLGRVPSGYLVVSKDENADIWSSSSSIPDNTKQIILIASASVNAKIYFF